VKGSLEDLKSQDQQVQGDLKEGKISSRKEDSNISTLGDSITKGINEQIEMMLDSEGPMVVE